MMGMRKSEILIRMPLLSGASRMSTTTTVVSPLPAPAAAPPSVLSKHLLASLYRMTVEEYERLAEAGVLEDSRVELIQGLLVRKMSKNPPHSITTGRLLRILEGLVPPGWHLRKEEPVVIPDHDEPEPDLAVVAGALEDYEARHPGPGDLALLVEVSETTLDRDQNEKLSAYAHAGIPVYWIVNLVDRQVEVYTNPRDDGYQDCQVNRPGALVPVVIAGVEVGRIAVDDILPPAQRS
jgi:Uma2 family endonuclease